jgi:hypothetical protein
MLPIRRLVRDPKAEEDETDRDDIERRIEGLG